MENTQQDKDEVDSLETLETGGDPGSNMPPAENSGEAPASPNSQTAPDSSSAQPAAGSSTQPTTGGSNFDADSGGSKPLTTGKKKRKLVQRLQDLSTQVNIYLLAFILIVIFSGIGVFVSQQRTQQDITIPELTPQELSDEALEEINENAVKIGDPKQTLKIESNTIFSGQVLVQGSLDVAGAIKAGGTLNLPAITVGGTGSFDQIQANDLSVSGNTIIQGTLNVQKTITVAGGATFGGAISATVVNAQRLQLSGDLHVTRHIDAGGATPGRSNGTALGGGGTTSISGTDTAGTVSINTGSSPGVGCFATVHFAIKFNKTPHVVITPVGSPAASINYYITRNASSFSICTTNPAPAHQNFAFDFIAID